jgi:hypothetical protein
LLYYGGADDAVKNALSAAITTWNAALNLEGGATPSLERITAYPTLPEAQLRTVTVTAEGATGGWCGFTNVLPGSARTMTLHRRPQGTLPCNGHVGTLPHLVLHEVGHVLGLGSGQLHTIGHPFVGVSDHCSIVLPAGTLTRINSGLCQHEIDLLLMAYEVYPNTYPTEVADYWGRHILNRVMLPATVTLREDETVVLNPTGPFFQYAGNPPSVGGVSVKWTSTAGLVATVEGSNVLTPRNPGNATVSAVVLQTGLPQNVRVSSRLASYGQAVAVTVKRAEWAPGYRVTDIIGPGTPIVDTGYYPLSTTVVNGGPRDSLRVGWKVIRSYAPADTQVANNTLNAFSLWVGQGSYKIRVIATPKDLQSDSTGGAFARDYTVCTGQGIFLRLEQPDAVEGCGGQLE